MKILTVRNWLSNQYYENTLGRGEKEKREETIVCVFPENVGPYANTETLYPSNAD